MALPIMLSSTALMGGGAGLLGASLFDPLGRVISHSTNNVWPNEVLDIGSTIRLMWTHPQHHSRLAFDQRLVGYSDEKVNDFLRASIRWPTVDEILQLILLGKISEDEPFQFTDTNGESRLITIEQLFNSAQVPRELDALYKSMRERPLPLGTSVALFRRFGDYLDFQDEQGVTDFGKDPVGGKYFDLFRESSKAEGFERFDPSFLFDAFRQYPGVVDIIRMAVREVFTPEIATAFGLFDEFPDEFREQSRRLGLSPEDAKNYWGSHWDLPSISQGFEMFHRRVIDRDDLNLLLRAKDVMPFWREKLTKISFRVKRLVDIYRLYEQRVIPRIDPENLTIETPLVKEFMDRGYNPEDAISLSLWLDRTRPDPGTEATIKAAERSFEKGYIDQAQLETVFDSLVLPKATREFILTASKVRKEQQRLERTVKRLKPLLLDGTVSQKDFITALERFNLSQESIRDLIEEIEAERADTTKGLSESQILRLYKGDYLKNKQEAIDLLRRNGRSLRAAFVLIQEADDDKRTGVGTIPFDDMKGFFSSGIITEVLFTDYLKAKGVPLFGINAYIETLKPTGQRTLIP